jgi:hypothetical protein
MIITAPFRRMILHLSHRGFIDVRIFMSHFLRRDGVMRTRLTSFGFAYG